MDQAAVAKLLVNKKYAPIVKTCIKLCHHFWVAKMPLYPFG